MPGSSGRARLRAGPSGGARRGGARPGRRRRRRRVVVHACVQHSLLCVVPRSGRPRARPPAAQAPRALLRQGEAVNLQWRPRARPPAAQGGGPRRDRAGRGVLPALMEPHAAHAVGAAGGASGGGDATATDTAAPGVLLAAEPPVVIGIMSVAAPLLAWMAVRCALEGVRSQQWPGL